MTINSNNYEDFFLLYVDNELEAAQRAEVEAFAAAHPDLQGELNALLQTKLSSAEEISFEGKALLYKQEMPGLITADNYETFFLLYADNELPAAQRAAVERFVEEHPAKNRNGYCCSIADYRQMIRSGALTKKAFTTLAKSLPVSYLLHGCELLRLPLLSSQVDCFG